MSVMSELTQLSRDTITKNHEKMKIITLLIYFSINTGKILRFLCQNLFIFFMVK